MDEMNKTDLAAQIENIAKKAGKFIKKKKISKITEKGNVSNVVTDIDVKCQQLIINECLSLLPQSTFLAEEENLHQISDGFTWIIDPIDGTTNYVYDYRHSCISIALFYRKKGLIGVVYDPYLDECFVGIEGEYSTCNGEKIHVSSNAIHEALVTVGTSPYNKELADTTFRIIKSIFLNTRDIRRSGSAALDMCYLACGRIDAFYEQLLQPWDYAAAGIIVTNANGRIASMEGFSLEELKPTGVICANPICYEPFRDLIL